MADPSEKMTKDTLSKVVGVEQVNRLLAYYDLDKSDGEEVKKVIERARQKLAKHFSRGNLEIEQESDGRLFLLIHLRCKVSSVGDTIKLKPLSGKSKIAMKGYSDDDVFGKVYGLIGSLAGLSADKMQLIEGPDVGLFDELFALFLAV